MSDAVDRLTELAYESLCRDEMVDIIQQLAAAVPQEVVDQILAEYEC